MRQQQLQTFDRPAATVMKMFGDRPYFERKCVLLGYVDTDVLEYQQSADESCIRLRYRAAAKLPLPDFARRFVPGLQTVTEEHRWDLGRRQGRLKIDIAGLPVAINVALQLTEQGDGACNTLDWNVRCAVPLLGARLEQLLMDELLARSADDHVASQQLLADY